jgi:hypothetical protein
MRDILYIYNIMEYVIMLFLNYSSIHKIFENYCIIDTLILVYIYITQRHVQYS